MIGIREASVRFNSAYFDSGSKDVQLTAEATDKGYKIVAEGHDVMFIEFGTGVYYNGSEPHPERPSNVGKIGSYGKGHGKRNAWYFNDDDGTHKTHGIPAAMPMYHASAEMERRITEIAREVFR